MMQYSDVNLLGRFARQRPPARLAMLALVALGVMITSPAMACPFCKAVKTTLREDIEASDVAVLAELIERPNRPDPDEGILPAADVIDSYKATFRIAKIYKGDSHVAVGQRVIAIYTGASKPGGLYLLRGTEPKALQWAPPLELSDRAQAYVERVIALPNEEAKRLQFVEAYLEDPDTLLRNDAFDEFAQADYEALKEMKDSIDHDRLVGWIKNPEVLSSNRRLYFTMLGVCGTPEDAKMLGTMIASGDRTQMTGLDALIACYLSLAGADGLPLIERLFLKSGALWDPDFVHTNSAILALRFHGEEESSIPRPRLLEAMRVVLERPQLADLVIRDLARWKDWESMDRLVALFKEAKDTKSWVRVPVLRYLKVCPLPEAKQHLAELSKLDPDAAQRAASFFPFPSKPAKKTKDPTPSSKKPSSSKKVVPGKTENSGRSSNLREPGSEAQPEVSAAWFVGVPMGISSGLFLMMALILRRPRERAREQTRGQTREQESVQDV